MDKIKPTEKDLREWIKELKETIDFDYSIIRKDIQDIVDVVNWMHVNFILFMYKFYIRALQLWLLKVLLFKRMRFTK